ncbi:MAG: tetratricopeptide repeat protein [Bacteroidia bacterium]|nr:tetratricopeptide repeat protein [Bacteroidia bacterium]
MKNWICALWVCLIGSVASAQPGAEAELAARYFADAEYEKALTLYEELYRKEPEALYVRRAVLCYEQLNRFEEAIRLLERAARREPRQPIYPVLQAGLLEKTGNLREAEQRYREVIGKQLGSPDDFIQIGSYLYQAGKLDLARDTYLQGRKRLQGEYAFAEELAHIYEQQGQFAAATGEYLNQYYQDAAALGSVSLALSALATPEAQAEVEQVLVRESEKRSGEAGLRTLLYDFYVAARNFPEAFVQVKAIDRLFREDGSRVYRFAEILRSNKLYDLSNQALDYLIDRKQGSDLYSKAFFEKAVNAELKAFDQVPADEAALRQAVADYGRLLDEFGRQPVYFDAIYRRASLMVFYLNDLDDALLELETAAAFRGLSADAWGRAKLLIGDILLMQQEYNKAKLTYTEVSDAFRDRQLGATAKYKLAQLAYYRGEFSLAQAQLDAIKENTSNDISNDAIRLNLLIMDNTGLDTTTDALQLFARAQLLGYQRRYSDALALLDSLAYQYPNHPLGDEIIWEKASVFLKRNDIQTALVFVDRIIQEFPSDIYGDDALYTKARIYDYTLRQPEQAMKLYLEFLAQYPGSLFSVEVRKRVRELRQG